MININAMNKFMLGLSIVIFSSCNQKESKADRTTTEKISTVAKDTTHTETPLAKETRKAILLGSTIILRDQNFKEIKDISYLQEQFVEIKEVSASYHKNKPTHNRCEEFKYVKIKTKEQEGYVDGRNVYEIIKKEEVKSAQIDHDAVSFTPTSFFGVGASDDNGLTFCTIYTPVIFYDSAAKYEGLVKMVKNKNYESDYPYFELKADDGANDEIEHIEKKQDRYLLTIKRMYQEGEAHILVAVYKNNKGLFVAEILENKRTTE